MQKSVRELPEHYRLDGKLDLKERKGLALALNVAAGVSVIGYAFLFLLAASALRSTEAPVSLQIQVGSVVDLLLVLLRLFVITALMLLLHEGVHGVFFRLYTGKWGTFAFKGLYAYAAAPDWYLPRNQHVVTALAPYLGLSLLGILLIPVMPRALLLDLLLFLVLNAAGALGDLAVVAWLLTKPSTARVNDYGDGVAIYVPGQGTGSTQ